MSKKNVVKSRTVTDYSEVKTEAMKPASQRQAIVKGRTGNKIPRRYGLADKDVKNLRATCRKSGFQNPYRSGGVYHGAVAALISLGIDKAHKFSEVKAEMKKVMSKIDRNNSNAWKTFAERKPRNVDTGKDIDGRIVQTFYVLQRITGFHPYGEKLRQLFACIDILVDGTGVPMFRLNTKFKETRKVKTINELYSGKRKAKIAKTIETVKAVKKNSEAKATVAKK